MGPAELRVAESPPHHSNMELTFVPTSLPAWHRPFVERVCELFARDTRVVGIAAGGSWLTDSMDAFSDLDFVVVTENDAHASALADALMFAESMGSLVGAFTGDHVGEPRLLICLYDGTPPLHVDFKFVAERDLDVRVEDPAVLWERDGRVTAALTRGDASYPAPSVQWIEDRFWVWVHYITTKIGRGEMYEVLDALAFLRARVLGPLALVRAGARPAGVRRIEVLAPAAAESLAATVATRDAADGIRALRAAIELYVSLRGDDVAVVRRTDAERVARRYLDDISAGLPRAQGSA